MNRKPKGNDSRENKMGGLSEKLKVFKSMLFKRTWNAAQCDVNKLYFITASHDNNIINYLNMAAKWYISRNFQLGKRPIWPMFLKFLDKILLGEKKSISNTVRELLH